VSQENTPDGNGEKGGEEKKNSHVPSLVEAQAEIAAKRVRPEGAAATGPAGPPGIRPGAAQRVATLAEVDAAAEALYARHKKVFPRQVTGLFADLRILLASLTLGIFYGLPWLNWGEGRQAFLIDLPGRKFNLFYWTFWPQDLFYLSVILILSALLLFFFTAIFGRVWCGFTCPQTVWTEVFLWIERKIDGDRMQQLKLAKQRWNAEKLLKRTAKYGAWVLFSLWTGFTFVGFFTPIRELAASSIQFTLGPWETFWVFFYGFATFGNAGFLREQVCIYMCPYARFQGAMFDRNTLIISYDRARGEPRGARGRVVDPKVRNLGHCIDCTLCVQVCPTGIDIRNGLQYQCIACAACVDVCDSVMEKMNYPKGLIRYTSENALEGKPWRLLRPRVLIYAALLAAIGAALVISVLLRVPLDIDVVRDRNTLYRETGEGRVENVYTVRVLNMDHRPHRYRITAAGIDGLTLGTDGHGLTIESGQVREMVVRLQADPAVLRERSSRVTFRVEAEEDASLVDMEQARFLGPVLHGR
jgi:cytochrome c oxidase accessory protein FixG